MAFCTFCGSKINEGEVCACRQTATQNTAATNPYAAPNNAYSQPQNTTYSQPQNSTYQTTPTQYYSPSDKTYYSENFSNQPNPSTYSTAAKVLSIISFVLGILGVVLSWASLGGNPLFLLCSIAAIVTRSIARNKGTTNLAGMGTAGFALGIVGTALGGLFFIIFLGVAAASY